MNTQQELNNVFEYYPDTGNLLWKISPSKKVKMWSIAGSILIKSDSKKKYKQVGYKGEVYRVHRVIWKMLYNEEPDEIDHIDGNGLNNKLSNLRSATREINNKNLRLYETNTSGICGVRFLSRINKWIAIKYIKIDGKTKGRSLGCFSSFFDACCARKSFEHKDGYHPNHGNRRPL